MRRLILLAGLAILPLTGQAGEAHVNKCIDARGAVTYSNLPCRSGQDARAIAIDAAPAGGAAGHRARQQGESAPAPAPAPLTVETRTVSGKEGRAPTAKKCAALANKLGAVLDKMDQARRQGYTQPQMAKWNEEIRVLKRKKQQAGCF